MKHVKQLFSLLTGVKDEFGHTDFHYLTNEQKLQAVMRMENPYQVFDLFRSNEDKYGKYSFYHMPYHNFKRIVFEKFPQMNSLFHKKIRHNATLEKLKDTQHIHEG